MRKITLLTQKKNFLSSSISMLCFCAFFLLFVAVTACSNDDDGEPTPPPVEDDGGEVPIDPSEDPKGSITGDINEWDWNNPNADKGLVDAVQ